MNEILPAPSIPADFTIPGYWELIQHLSKEEKESLNRDLEQVSSTETREIERQFKSNLTPYALNTATAKQTMLAALKAFKEQIISLEQLASLHILDGAIRDLLTHLGSHYLTMHIQDGKIVRQFGYTKVTIDPTLAEKAISRHKYDSVIALEARHATNFEIIDDKPQLKEFFALDDEEWLKFRGKLETKCESEKYYNIITAPRYGCWSITHSNLKEFIRPLHEQKILFALTKGVTQLKCMLVPSFSMLQVLLDIRAEAFQREPLSFRPMYGQIDKNSLGRMKFNGGEPLNLYWPEANLDKQYNWDNTAFKTVLKDAYDQKEGPFGTNMLNIFDALREIENKKNIREACLYLANLTDTYGKLNKKDVSSLKYWLESSQLFPNPQSRLFKDSGDAAKTVALFAQAKFGDVFYGRPIASRLDDELKSYFIKDMVIHQEIWKEQFHLGREDLREQDQTLYDSYTHHE